MSTTPIPAHLNRPGFKVTEVRTDNYEFPGRAAPPAQASGPGSKPHPHTAPLPQSLVRDPIKVGMNSLPPGHPAAQRLAAHMPVAEVQVEKLAPQSETDPQYMSISLPSLFRFYDFKHLSVRNIKGFHQAKFSRAAKEANVRYLVEAISSTMGDKVSAFDLTSNDFYFVMYWQRINSYPKNPQIITHMCDNMEHLKATQLPEGNPKRKTLESLKIEAFLDNTTTDTVYLEEWDMSKWADLDEKYGLGVETMRDIVDFEDLQEEMAAQRAARRNRPVQARTVDEEADDEISEDELMWLGGRAAFLAKLPGRESLQARIEIVKQMDADEIAALEEYKDAVTAYGVKEFANLKCKECGAHHRVQLSVDALSFLPGV